MSGCAVHRRRSTWLPHRFQALRDHHLLHTSSAPSFLGRSVPFIPAFSRPHLPAMALVRSTRGAMSPLLLRPGLRAMVAPPAALLAQTEKNAAAYEKVRETAYEWAKKTGKSDRWGLSWSWNRARSKRLGTTEGRGGKRPQSEVERREQAKEWRKTDRWRRREQRSRNEKRREKRETEAGRLAQREEEGQYPSHTESCPSHRESTHSCKTRRVPVSDREKGHA